MATDISNLRETLQNEMQGELNRIQLRCAELDTLAEQCQVEITRLQAKNVDLNQQLHHEEANLDPHPNDFKKHWGLYESLLDAKTRLVIMQCQFEKYMQERTQLDAFREVFIRFESYIEQA